MQGEQGQSEPNIPHYKNSLTKTAPQDPEGKGVVTTADKKLWEKTDESPCHPETESNGNFNQHEAGL